MRGFIDLHNHVLPALDDGAPDLDAAALLLRGMHGLGFSEIHPTPHQKARAWAPEANERARALGSLSQRAQEEGLEVAIHAAGGENMWDDLFLQRQDPRSFPCYEGDRAFLLEFRPGALPPQLPERLFAFRLAGLLPLIAHVERYPEFELLRRGDHAEGVRGKAALQVNLSSLGGLGGWGQKRLARKLVLADRIHVIATDAHGPPDLRFGERGLRWLEKQLPPDDVERLLSGNPRQILAGEIPD